MAQTYADIDLDRPRKLCFRIQDLRELCRRLGGISIVGLLEKLGALDLDAVHVAVMVGLRQEDRRLTAEKVDDLIQGYVDKHGSLVGLLTALNDAIERSGVVRRREEDSPPGEGRPATA